MHSHAQATILGEPSGLLRQGLVMHDLVVHNPVVMMMHHMLHHVMVVAHMVMMAMMMMLHHGHLRSRSRSGFGAACGKHGTRKATAVAMAIAERNVFIESFPWIE